MYLHVSLHVNVKISLHVKILLTWLYIFPFVTFPPMDFFVFQHFATYYQDEEKKPYRQMT